MRERQCNAQTLALGTRDREFSPALPVEVAKAEHGGGSAQNLGPGASPDPLGRRVEMRDAMILIQDYDSIIGPLECGQEDIGTFYRKMVVHGHQRLDPAGNTLREKPIASAVFKGLCNLACCWDKNLSLRIRYQRRESRGEPIIRKACATFSPSEC